MKAWIQRVDNGTVLTSGHTTKEKALEETARSVGDLIEFALTRHLRINIHTRPDNKVAVTMSDSSEWLFWVE